MPSLPHICGVYRITCTENQKVYIGSSVHVFQRWREHRSCLNRNCHQNAHLQYSWLKYGESAFGFALIEETTREQMIAREEYWIHELNSHRRDYGFNIVATPTSPNLGKHLSDAHKLKLSIALTGRVFSEEHRARKSIANTGRYYSPETRAKIAAGASRTQKGRTKSPEHRAKIGEANNKLYIVTSPDGIAFKVRGLIKLCEEYGLDQAAMANVTNGKRNHHKGWKCRRVDD